MEINNKYLRGKNKKHMKTSSVQIQIFAWRQQFCDPDLGKLSRGITDGHWEKVKVRGGRRCKRSRKLRQH